jgi:8-oxo-dGTP pyrophosphatase MutT (NUDIX family)
VTKRRADVHRDGDWHAALHIWVGSLVDGVPHVLLQRRSRTKDTWPGRIDVAVGGHLGAGEDLATAMREAREEIGLSLSLDDVTPLGRRFVQSGPNDNEVQDVFAVRADLPLSAFTPHPLEVEALLQLSIDDARDMFRDGRAVAAVELERDASREQTVLLTPDAFVPDDSTYYEAALDGLRDVVLGRPVERFLLR